MQYDESSVSTERHPGMHVRLDPAEAAVIADVLEVDLADLGPHLELDSLAVLEVFAALSDEGLLLEDLGDLAEIPELPDMAALAAFLRDRSPSGS